MWWVALAPAAYVLGTFPSAAIVASASGVDITTSGSGNPGASNVTRTLGWRKGVLVFALDALKGAIAALVGLWLGGRAGGYVLGGAAIVGHVFPLGFTPGFWARVLASRGRSSQGRDRSKTRRGGASCEDRGRREGRHPADETPAESRRGPLWRGLRGGKGVATGGGVIAVIHPIVGVAVGAIWLGVSRLTGKAAIASIAAVVAAPIALAIAGAPAWEFAAMVGLCSLLVVRHAGNIKRILRREERGIGHEGTAA